MGIIFASLASAVAAVFRTMDTSTRRLNETKDAQNLVTWLPVDVASAPAANLQTSTAQPSGCGGVSPGVNILWLSWTEAINGTTTTYVANYRAVPDGTGMRLQRFSCSGTSSLGAPFGRYVSNALPALPAGWAPGQAPVAVTINGTIVTFTLTQVDGRIIRVDTSQKNPAATLPPVPTTTATAATSTTTSTTTTVPTTTTTVAGTTTTVAGATTTTVAPSTTTIPPTTTTIPCVVSSATTSPSSVNTHSQAPNVLQDDVTVTITKTGPCQSLQLQYDTGGSMGLLYQNFTTTAPYTVTLRGFKSGGTEIWTAGSHTLFVIDNSKTVLKTTTLTVS